MLSQKLQNSITLLLISNHFTGSKLRNAYNTKFFHYNLQITSVQQTFLHFWSSHHTTNSFYPLICSCHSPTPFKFLKVQNFWQIFLLSSACTLECPTTPSSLSFSFFSISFSSLTIFFSIPQAAENSLFSSFLSSLAYFLSTGLTPWNFDLACLSFIIHSISFILDPFICSTRCYFMLSYSVSE